MNEIRLCAEQYGLVLIFTFLDSIRSLYKALILGFLSVILTCFSRRPLRAIFAVRCWLLFLYLTLKC